MLGREKEPPHHAGHGAHHGCRREQMTGGGTHRRHRLEFPKTTQRPDCGRHSPEHRGRDDGPRHPLGPHGVGPPSSRAGTTGHDERHARRIRRQQPAPAEQRKQRSARHASDGAVRSRGPTAETRGSHQPANQRPRRTLRTPHRVADGPAPVRRHIAQRRHGQHRTDHGGPHRGRGTGTGRCGRKHARRCRCRQGQPRSGTPRVDAHQQQEPAWHHILGRTRPCTRNGTPRIRRKPSASV